MTVPGNVCDGAPNCSAFPNPGFPSPHRSLFNFVHASPSYLSPPLPSLLLSMPACMCAHARARVCDLSICPSPQSGNTQCVQAPIVQISSASIVLIHSYIAGQS